MKVGAFVMETVGFCPPVEAMFPVPETESTPEFATWKTPGAGVATVTPVPAVTDTGVGVGQGPPERAVPLEVTQPEAIEEVPVPPYVSAIGVAILTVAVLPTLITWIGKVPATIVLPPLTPAPRIRLTP